MTVGGGATSTGAMRRRARSAATTVALVLALALLIGLVASMTRSGLGDIGWGSGPDCVVETEDGEIDLTRDQAQRAMTAVVASAASRVHETPDVADLDPAVLRRLAEGPPEDAGPSLTCRPSEVDDLVEEGLTATGLTPRAQRVLDEMTEVFGPQSLGGFAPGGVRRGGASTHNDGRAIDIFFRPVSEENRREGWLLAQWLVAHAEELDIQYVIFDDQFWYAGGRRGQWRDYDAPAPADEILRHLDHVHVDVWRGE